MTSSFHFAVFTKDKELGNPAAVVTDFLGNETEMQLLAKKLNMPATVFILPSANAGAAVKLRFFSPHSELSMCGHGTLAATSYLFSDRQEGELIAETQQGKTINIRKRRDGVLQFDSLPAQILNIDFNRKVICDLLRLENPFSFKNNLPFCVASIGSPKLIVPVQSRDVLMSLSPNFNAILVWSSASKVNGLYVYTDDVVESSSNFHARSFNPLSGNNEDAATGVAAAALASVYANAKDIAGDIVIEQGDCINRASRLTITVEGNKLKIGGYSVRANGSF
jgi:trans-2,3-dihydro-3-hydroxyanthranilate isomerase